MRRILLLLPCLGLLLACNGPIGNHGGLYLRADDSPNWQKVDEGLPPGDPVTHLGRRKTLVLASTTQHGLYMNWDGLHTWLPSANGLPSTPEIVSMLSIGENCLLGTREQGIFLSKNNGSQWEPSGAGLGNTHITCLATHQQQVYCGTTRGIYLSPDRGLSWKPAWGDKWVYDFASHQDAMLAALEDGIVRSTDQGLNWKYVWQGGRVTQLVSLSGSVLAVTEENVFYQSTDAGQSWQKLTTNPPRGIINQLLFHDGKTYACMSNGLFVAGDDPAHWEQAEGLPAGPVLDILPCEAGLLVSVGL
ncbi:MAG: hypothetical protein H6581_16440 [Bacteroidia bacterium]|nr:hypothetical protein [Bacteroidia bacterium]